MNRERLIWIGVILLILAIAVWIGRRDGRKLEQMRNQSELLEREVRELSTARDVALSRAKAESEQRTKIIIAKDSEQAAMKAQISTLKKRISKYTSVAIVQPAQIAIDTATMFYPCADRDSVINLQDHLIVSMESEQTAVNDSYNRQIAQMDSAMTAEKSISETWRVGNQESQRKLKRETRRKKLFSGLATVGGVVIGVLLISVK